MNYTQTFLTLLKDSWVHYKANWQDVIKVMLVYIVLAFLGMIAMGAFVATPGIGMKIIGILIVILYEIILASLLQVVLYKRFIKQETASSPWSSFWHLRTLAVPMTLILIATGILMGIGFILLIVPCVFAWLWFLFAPFVFLEKGTNVITSLRESKHVTKGHMKMLFVVMIFFTALFAVLPSIIGRVFQSMNLSFLDTLISVALVAIVTPLSFVFRYKLYKKITDEQQIQVQPLEVPAHIQQ